MLRGRTAASVLAPIAAAVAVIVINGSDTGLTAARDRAPLRDNGFPEIGKRLFYDNGSGDAAARWGRVDCAVPTRVRTAVGGRSTQSGTGVGRDARAFRHLKVADGDNVYGERCELGLNDNRTGPTALYHEGDRLLTFASIRLPRQFPLGRTDWQTVLQMKQAQPAAAGGGSPQIELEARHGKWLLINNWDVVWSARARKGAWTRFAFDVRYSQNPNVGTMRVYVDRNGDGDALDNRERSRMLHFATLRRETEGGLPTDGIAPGDSIPSHLRVGIYHDPVYHCERNQCSLGIDDVGVYERP